MKVDRLIGLVMICLALSFGYPASADGPERGELAAMSQTMEQVNVNEADAATLERVLIGVGRSRAEAIVAYREANGKFYSPDELTAVRGIGDSTVRRNRERIRVE